MCKTDIQDFQDLKIDRLIYNLKCPSVETTTFTSLQWTLIGFISMLKQKPISKHSSTDQDLQMSSWFIWSFNSENRSHVQTKFKKHADFFILTVMLNM